MQLSGSFGRLPPLRGAGTRAGDLVRMVTAEQAAVGALDHRRLSGCRHPQDTQRLLIGTATIGQWLALRRVIGRQCLKLLWRPAQPLAPLVDQVALRSI